VAYDFNRYLITTKGKPPTMQTYTIEYDLSDLFAAECMLTRDERVLVYPSLREPDAVRVVETRRASGPQAAWRAICAIRSIRPASAAIHLHSIMEAA
jgi:hypothetical protein